MSVRLFVGNLPYDVTESELREFFTPVGRPSRVFLPVDRETGKQRGFAFIELASQEEGDEAIRRLNSQSFKGRPIAVKEARERESRPARPMEPRSGPAMPRAGAPGLRTFPDSRGSGVGAPDDSASPVRRRARAFGGGRPDRRRKEPPRQHKSEWGKKAFMRKRGDFEDDEDFNKQTLGYEQPDDSDINLFPADEEDEQLE
jgi:RNA recognition motif-containing protein